MSAIDRDDISMLCFEKKTTREKYIYIFTDDQRAELLRTFGRQACNAELSFSWYDAANLSMQVRELDCAGR